MDQLPSSRQELVHNAVLFLKDSKVQSSSLTSRIEFLQSKGLTEPEIEIALEQARSQHSSNNGTPTTAGPSRNFEPPPTHVGGGGYGTRYAIAPHPPEVPKRDWRDMFIMAVVSGGVVYGLSVLARKYLVPHLRPPSSTAFQSTSAQLSEQYDEAARLLTSLQERTDALYSSVQQDHERVGSAVEEVEEAVKLVKEGEERWREEMRDIRAEVESVRELVPRLIERHAQSQTAALAELQSEVRSLKTLLLSRQGLSSSSSTLQTSTANGHNANANADNHGSPTTANGSSSPTPTQLAANALLAPKGRGIPAWQMPPTSSAGSSKPSSTSGAEGDAKEVLNGKGNGVDAVDEESR